MTISTDGSAVTGNPAFLTSLGQTTTLSIGALTNIGTELVDVTFLIDDASNAMFATPKGPSKSIEAKSQMVDGANPIQLPVAFASGSGFVGLIASLVSQVDGSHFHRGGAVSLPAAAAPQVAAFAAAAQAAAHAAAAHATAAKAIADGGGSITEVATHAAAASAAAASAAGHAASAHNSAKHHPLGT